MAPLDGLRPRYPSPEPNTRTSPPTRASLSTEGGFLEAWAQGYNVGSLVILILIVLCNYRPGIWLHKLILLELVLALWHGTFIFVDDPAYGWYLSSTAILLFISYQLHNIISWIKIKPFLPKWGSRFFIYSLLAVQPFWVAEAWSNVEYFNHLGSEANVKMRPWEALVRDPWWIFTTWKLIDAIKKTYGFKLWALVKINSRFGVMLLCMFISIAFLLTDIGVSAARVTAASGINPYWRFALVFKCASDTIFLDDFKSVLDDIIAQKFSSAGSTVHGRTVHRGSCAGGESGAGTGAGAHKHSRSYVRGADFIDLEPERMEMNGPITDISSPQPTARSRYLNPFSSRDHSRPAPVPRIHVQKETRAMSESRKPSHDSYGSDRDILSMPELAIYGTKKAHSSSGSLSIGPSRSCG